ncbi:MAG: hypothetical protein R6V06_08345 [Kiritimatiellia bacterium]
MRVIFNILCFIMIAVSGINAFAYNTLPDSRILIFDDYDDPVWEHTGEDAPIKHGQPLLDGTFHTHSEGWYLSEVRSGSAGNYGVVVPPDELLVNFAGNLRNVAGAFIESPYYEEGIGTIYFEAVDSEDVTSFTLYVATNMIYTGAGGGYSDIQPQEDAQHEYNWVEVATETLDYNGDDFGRYNFTLNYRDAAKFKIVRPDVSSQSSSEDDQFLVVDNIQVSYPAPYAEIAHISSEINPEPDFSAGNLFVNCSVDHYYSDYANTEPTVTLFYQIAPEEGGIFGSWQSIELNYVVGTGNGNGIGLEYEKNIPVPIEGQIQYYYVCDFGGHFEAQDYTGTGIDFPYPSESLSPVELYEDGMGGNDYFDMSWQFALTPPDTELSDSRILIFDDYDDPVWEHTGEDAPSKKGQPLLDGTYHVHDAGWYLHEVRGGNALNFGIIVPVGTVSNKAGNLRNLAGAYIESPYYADGVGTIYFDAVNSENAEGYDPMYLKVYMATNMFDTNSWAYVDMEPQESGSKIYHWQEVDNVILDHPDGAQGEFTRYFRKFNYRDAAKIRFKREETSGGSLAEDDQFIVVDNIRISPPPVGVDISKSEVVSNPGYPDANDTFTVRCTVDNKDMNVLTDQRFVSLVSRWRYLDQQVDDWQTNLMSLVEGTGDGNGNGEIYEFEMPAVEQEGDLEYYFVCYFSGYEYQSPDYTATGFEYPYPSENLSPVELRSEYELEEFSIRLRPYDSKYGSVRIVTDQHDIPIEMNLVDDYKWRGLVPLAGISPTNLTWSLVAENEYVEGSVSFETNTVYWSSLTSSGSRTPTLPFGGVGVVTNQDARIRISVSDGGYMEVSFNTDTLEFLANRAEYQNFNSWPARDDYFSESSGQADKRRYPDVSEPDILDQWEASQDQTFTESFTAYVSSTNEYHRDPFYTPGDWMAGSAAYVSERTLDTVYNPPGIVNYRNLALRLKGGDPVLGLGYVYNQIATLPDGMKTLKLKARIGQESDSYDIGYNLSSFSDYNYVIQAEVACGDVSPEEPSISLVAYYTSPNSYYEFRITQEKDMRDTVNAVQDSRLRLSIIKWRDGVSSVLKNKTIYNYSLGGSSRLMQIGLFNEGSSTKIRCLYSNTSGLIEVTDSSNPLIQGTFGIFCNECETGYSAVRRSNANNSGAPDGTSEDKMSPSDWYLPSGVFAYRTDVSTPGFYKVIPDQQLDVYLQPADYNSPDVPDAPGTASWTLHSHKTVSNFEYNEITIDFELWQSNFVLLQVGDGDNDVAVDELELKSWHGKEIYSGISSTEKWLATEAWIVTNMEGDVTNHTVQLNHNRGDPTVAQAVRSLLLENGMGMMEFDFRVLNPPAKLTVQYAEERHAQEWYDVQSFVFSNVTDWAHESAYVGTNDTGYIRVLNDRRGGYTNALVELDNVVVWDEPFIDVDSWKSYNSKITSTDPMRLLLDESRGCFLNNSAFDEASPSPLDRYNPHLQSPVLMNGLGEITFKARAYEPGSPATVYVYASTNGWSLPSEDWILIHQFEGIDHEFYQPYAFKPVDGSLYNAIRLESELDAGANRVCLEEVVISEPIYPGFDIVDVDLLLTERDGGFGTRKQPLTYEDVHVEARLINQKLSPSNITVYVSYYVGDDPWGVDNWDGSVVTRRMHEVAGEPGLYRTRNDNGGEIGLPQSQIGGILGQEGGSVVQYRVWASYLGGIPLYEYQEEFETPDWYYPVDYNQEKADQGWSPYYIVYSVPPGTVWINEINVGDLIYGDGFVIKHGIWENAYIEIATPAWLDLSGWKVDLVTQSDYVTHTITLPSDMPSLNPVTNGYAFFVIAETQQPYPETPVLDSDFGYAGLRWDMPARTPGGLRLRRPEGMYEQTIAYDDADRNTTSYYDGKVWAAADPEGRFVYVGEEQNEGSLSRTGTGDSTNTWVYPLFSDYDQDHEKFILNYTPGQPNGLQELPDAADLFPGVSNAMINSSMSRLRGSQNGKRVLDYSLRMRIGSSTNVHYEIDDWYRLVSLTSNGVEQLPTDTELTEYTYSLDEISTDVDIWATVNLREDLSEYEGDSTVINWVLSYPEAPLVPMFYDGRELTLTEQYWLDANPTISNEFNCVIRDFSFDGQTNLHVRLEMKLNENNLTNIQGAAVLKLESKQDLEQEDWDMIQQFYLTADSFDLNNECRVFVENPYEFILTKYDRDRFYMRWVIEMEDPRITVYELENNDAPE